MKKTCVFLAGILAIFIAFACEMPSSIQFKSERFEMNAPVKIASFNMASVLSEALKKSFPEGFAMYDMVNYRGAQAFLIAYQMDLMESFDPDDYLKNLTDGIPPINKTITIPKMTTNNMANNTILFDTQDMQIFFDKMRDTINDGITTQRTVSSSPYELPNFMVYEDCDNTKPRYFDSIMVNDGTIELDIFWLAGAAPGVNIDSVSFGGRSDPRSVSLDSSYDAGNKYTAEIDISGLLINKDDPPTFTLHGINSLSGYTLVMEPRIANITLSSATALKCGETTKSIPLENNISMAAIPNLYDAKITKGEFLMRPSESSFSENMLISSKIILRQQKPADISPYPQFQSLEGKTFTDRETDLEGKDYYISGEPLGVDNSSTITIRADPANGSNFTLAGGMLSVNMVVSMIIDELDDVRWKSNILPPIDIPEINFANMGEQNVSFINWIEFNEINLNIDFTVPDPPPSPSLEPGEEKGLSPELKNRIALKVVCPELGFDGVDRGPTDLSHNQPLYKGEHTFTSRPTPTERRLIIHDTDDTVKKVKFDAELIPVVNDVPDEHSPYIVFGPVTMSETEDITMNIYAQITLDFEWTEAEIDLQTALENTDSADGFKGTFPEETEAAVNLSNMSKYMHDIRFSDNLKAKIFFSGPDVIVRHFQPNLDFKAQWGADNESRTVFMLPEKQELEADSKLPPLNTKENSRGELEYHDPGLPTGKGVDLNGFDEIIPAFPGDLRFNYDMAFENKSVFIVVHNTFEEDEDTKIRALVVLLLPLELEVEEGGHFAIPGNIFGGSEDGDNPRDLFGRNDPGEASLFTGVDIKSLGIKITFGSPIFAGSYLHFDQGDKDGKNKLFGEEGLSVGNGNSLNIILTGKQQKIINDNLIYPDIKFKFPEKKTVRIGRSFLPARIVIAASGTYTLNLDDLLNPRSD